MKSDKKVKPGALALRKMEPLVGEIVDKTPAAVAAFERAVRASEGALRDALESEVGDKVSYVEGIGMLVATADVVDSNAGIRLVKLRRACAHGEFLPLLKHIGLSPRRAQKLMNAAVRAFGPNLEGASRTKLLELGPGKFGELMSLDDEELDLLAEGGEVQGLTMDAVDRMSVRDLRQRLRKAEKKVEDIKAAHDSDVAVANELKREIQRLRRQWSTTPVDEKLAARRDDLNLLVAGIESQLGDYGAERATAGLAGAVQALLDDAGDEHAAQAQVHVAAAIDRLQLALRALRDAYVIDGGVA